MRTRHRWRILDTRVFEVRRDDEQAQRVLREHIAHIKAQMRQTHAGAEIREFSRNIRAGGAVVPLSVIICRRKDAA